MTKLVRSKSHKAETHSAVQWLRKAGLEHERFVAALKAAKDRAMNCGLYLLNAQSALPPGESFEVFLEDGPIPRSTAYHYMRFASLMIGWAQQDRPRLKDDAKIIAHAREMVLQSGATFLELMRAAEVLKPNTGGGHRAESREEGALQQTWFDFTTFAQLADNLRRQHFKPLARVDPVELQEARKLLQSTITQIDQLLAAKALPAPSASNRKS